MNHISAVPDCFSIYQKALGSIYFGLPEDDRHARIIERFLGDNARTFPGDPLQKTQRNANFNKKNEYKPFTKEEFTELHDKSNEKKCKFIQEYCEGVNVGQEYISTTSLRYLKKLTHTIYNVELHNKALTNLCTTLFKLGEKDLAKQYEKSICMEKQKPKQKIEQITSEALKLCEMFGSLTCILQDSRAEEIKTIYYIYNSCIIFANIKNLPFPILNDLINKTMSIQDSTALLHKSL